jgi:hypothetical protein
MRASAPDSTLLYSFASKINACKNLPASKGAGDRGLALMSYKLPVALRWSLENVDTSRFYLVFNEHDSVDECVQVASRFWSFMSLLMPSLL